MTRSLTSSSLQVQQVWQMNYSTAHTSPRSMSWKGSVFKDISLCLCITSEEVGRKRGCGGLGFPKHSQACPSNDFLDGSCRTGLAGAGNQRQQGPGGRVPAPGRLCRSGQGRGALIKRSARTRFAARENVGAWSETRPLFWLPEWKDRWINGCMAACCAKSALSNTGRCGNLSPELEKIWFS